MTTYDPPKVNTEFIFYMSVISQANTKVFQDNPTIAAGDFKIALDDGAPANLTTIPAVDADFTKRIKVTVSAAENNGANFTIIASDALGDEWCDWMRNFATVTNQNDDLATPAQVNAQVVDVLRTDTIPDSYAADGAQPTFAQAMLEVRQFLTEFAIAGTTVTVKKPDSTTAMTFTLNDATNPTSITRAT